MRVIAPVTGLFVSPPISVAMTGDCNARSVPKGTAKSINLSQVSPYARAVATGVPLHTQYIPGFFAAVATAAELDTARRSDTRAAAALCR